MNKTPSRDQIRGYLNTYDMKPIHKLGQNFLTDDGIASAIVDACQLEDGDRVLEIGPGFGALTSHIQGRCESLELYELDKKMCLFLEERFGGKRNVRIVHQDALKADFSKYDIIVSNLPYYLTTPFIEKTYREGNILKRAVFMIQKDVLPRLTATVGQDGFGPLALMLSYCAVITPLFDVKPESFFPEPPVDSHVVLIEFKKEIERAFVEKLDKFVRAMFLSRRKTITNNLANYTRSKNTAVTMLAAAAIDPMSRPEQLGIEAFIALAKLLP